MTEVTNKVVGAVLVLFSLLYLFLVFRLTIYSLYEVHNSLDWAFSEYLINYSGGFVRRGLLGEVLSLFGHDLIVPIFNIVLMMVFAANLVFLIYLSRITTVSLVIPFLAIVMPAGVISMTVFGDFEIFARKEAIFYCFTMYCAVQTIRNYRIAQRETNCDHLVSAKVRMLIVQIFIFSILAMLSSEGFAFYSVPTLVIILSFNTLLSKSFYRNHVLVAYLLLISAIAGILFLNRGTADISTAIIAALPDRLSSYHEAIDILGWSVEQQLGQDRGAHGVLGELFIVVFQSLPILALYLVMFSFLCRKYTRHSSSTIDPVILGTFLFVFVSLSIGPYFFISGDWTRLLSSIAFNSLVLILVFTSTGKVNFERTFFMHGVKVRALSLKFVSDTGLSDKKYSFVIVWLMIWVALTFSISGSRHVGMYGMSRYLAKFKELFLLQFGV